MKKFRAVGCPLQHHPHSTCPDKIYILLKTKVLRFFLNWHNFFIVVNKKDYIIAFFNWHGILLCCNFKSNIIYSYYVKLKLRHGFYITILRLFWVLLLPIIIFFIPTTSIYVCKSLVNLVLKGTIIYFYDGTSPVRHKQNLCI